MWCFRWRPFVQKYIATFVYGSQHRGLMESREIHFEPDDDQSAGLECMFLVSIFTTFMRKGVEYKKTTILNLLSRTDLHTSISVSSGSDFKGLFLYFFLFMFSSQIKFKAITCSLVLQCSFLLTLSSHCSFQHWLLNSFKVVVLLRDINQGLLSHLECWWQNTTIVRCESIV